MPLARKHRTRVLVKGGARPLTITHILLLLLDGLLLGVVTKDAVRAGFEGE